MYVRKINLSFVAFALWRQYKNLYFVCEHSEFDMHKNIIMSSLSCERHGEENDLFFMGSAYTLFFRRWLIEK
jgi:hypothetical protein